MINHKQCEWSGYGDGKFCDFVMSCDALRTPPQLVSKDRFTSLDICNEKCRIFLTLVFQKAHTFFQMKQCSFYKLDLSNVSWERHL